jgi:cyanophycinase
MKHWTGGQGVLIPIGGAEDRGEEESPNLPFMKKGVLKHVLSEANGRDSNVVVITTASSVPDEVFAMYLLGFKRLGCKNVTHYHMTTKVESEDKEMLKVVGNADVVYISGGNQSRIPIAMRNTSLHSLLHKRYEKDALVIAGTSAGAMCMSDKMISGGSASESFIKGAVKMRKGLGFIPALIIDTHFVRRGRFGRLAESVAGNPMCIGLGLAEDSGVVISEGGTQFRVIGSGMVIVMDPRSVTHNKYAELEEGTLLSMTGLTTHFLSNGDRFSIEKHTVEVLPLGAEYI